MITEDYCSFEVAKLLNEKGFDVECETSYYISNEGCENAVFVGDFTKVRPWREALIAAPTHQMAMKWLREKHKLLISVDASPIYGKVKNEKGRNTCGLLYWHYMASSVRMNDKYNPQQKAFVVSEKSYKKAVESALKYSLENLI